jgi:hypothetical protein
MWNNMKKKVFQLSGIWGMNLMKIKFSFFFQGRNYMEILSKNIKRKYILKYRVFILYKVLYYSYPLGV